MGGGGPHSIFLRLAGTGHFIEKRPDLKFAITLSHQYSPEITYYTHGKVFGWVDRDRTRDSQYNYWKFPDALRVNRCVCVPGRRWRGPTASYFNVVGEKVSLTVMKKRPPPAEITSLSRQGVCPARPCRNIAGPARAGVVTTLDSPYCF